MKNSQTAPDTHFIIAVYLWMYIFDYAWEHLSWESDFIWKIFDEIFFFVIL